MALDGSLNYSVYKNMLINLNFYKDMANKD